MSDFVADITKSVPHVNEDLVLDAGVQSITIHAAETVDVPSITDHDIAIEAHTLAGVKQGDFIILAPVSTVLSNAWLQGAVVTAANVITFVFGSLGGNVTGATKNYDIIVYHRS